MLLFLWIKESLRWRCFWALVYRLIFMSGEPHYWDYWVICGKPLDIPKREIRLMVAFWIAMGRVEGLRGSSVQVLERLMSEKKCDVLIHTNVVSYILSLIGRKDGFSHTYL